MCDYVVIHGLWPVVWLDGRNITEKLVIKKSGEEVCG